MTSQKLIETARENGKKGGRPPGSYGERRLREEALRTYIFKLVKKNQYKMVKTMIAKSLAGDVAAFNALMDRAVGKPSTLAEEAIGDLEVTRKLNELQDAFKPLTDPTRGNKAVCPNDVQVGRKASRTNRRAS